MIEITQTQERDLNEIAQIERAIFSLPWSRDGFAASIASEHTVYLTARLDGTIAGYCGMTCCLDEGSITNVAVKQEYRRKGIACAMLRELLKEGQKRGVSAFTLEARQSNAAALALYQKLGFQICGVRKNFYERPIEDAVIMWKR